MPNPLNDLETMLLEMRWRVLSLAADFDRLERFGADHPLIQPLRQSIRILLDKSENRAEQVQMLLSDRSERSRP